MIHHVSGIPDYEEGLPALRTADGEDLELENKDYLSIDEFYDRVKTIPLFAPPETVFAYSNTSYFLLSQVQAPDPLDLPAPDARAPRHQQGPHHVRHHGRLQHQKDQLRAA